MMLVLRTVTAGMFVLQAVWAIGLGFRAEGAPNMPAALWVAAVLVAPVALAVYWRPSYRVPNCLFLTGASALLLGLVGAGWGSVAAPVIGGLTLVALLFAPRDGGWRARWGRDDAAADSVR